MTIEPDALQSDPDLLERIEKATLRLVVQALVDFGDGVREIFAMERQDAAARAAARAGSQDAVDYIGEDITREALDRLGTSVIPIRLAGNIDYKKARYVFQPDFSVGQALFVDSKVEDVSGAGTATIQMDQTSMAVRQIRGGIEVDNRGGVPMVVQRQGKPLLATTIFVKYSYQQQPLELRHISVVCLPNGMLQARYNPDSANTFWLAGRNAPTRGEPFRVRIGLSRLKARARWKVQRIGITPPAAFIWDE